MSVERTECTGSSEDTENVIDKENKNGLVENSMLRGVSIVGNTSQTTRLRACPLSSCTSQSVGCNSNKIKWRYTIAESILGNTDHMAGFHALSVEREQARGY